MRKPVDECTSVMRYDETPEGKFCVEFKITGFGTDDRATHFMQELQHFVRAYAAISGGRSSALRALDADTADEALAIGEAMRTTKR